MDITTFIFLTEEGYTYEPSDENRCIENLQVLGFADGVNATQAFSNLISENTWLKETSFSSVFSYPLGKDHRTKTAFHDLTKA